MGLDGNVHITLEDESAITYNGCKIFLLGFTRISPSLRWQS